jgi:hypothetical protein
LINGDLWNVVQTIMVGKETCFLSCSTNIWTRDKRLLFSRETKRRRGRGMTVKVDVAITVLM